MQNYFQMMALEPSRPSSPPPAARVRLAGLPCCFCLLRRMCCAAEPDGLCDVQAPVEQHRFAVQAQPALRPYSLMGLRRPTYAVPRRARRRLDFG